MYDVGFPLEDSVGFQEFVILVCPGGEGTVSSILINIQLPRLKKMVIDILQLNGVSQAKLNSNSS
jgi:hypothetical protein